MRRRVMFAIVAASAVSLALFALPLAEVVQEYYRDQATVAVDQQAASAATALSTGTWTAAAVPQSGRVLLGAYDASGARIGGRGPDRADEVVAAALDGQPARATKGSGGLAFALPITGPTPAAAVRAESSSSVVDDEVRRAWATIVLIGAAVLAVVTTGGWFMTRRLVRPVQTLTSDLVRLGDGDFRIDPTRTGVSEIDEAHRALEHTAERLGAALDRERAFSADVAHQLRTPITALQLGLESELAAPRADRTIALHEALGETARLHATTEEILVLARETRPVPEPIELGPIVTGMQERWKRRFRPAGRDLVLVAPPARVRTPAHRSALEQIIDILLDNALKHGSGTTTLTARRSGDGTAITVEDEGPGFKPATAPPNGERQAIGLHLARRLAEADGGRLVLPIGPPARVQILYPPDPTLRDEPDGPG